MFGQTYGTYNGSTQTASTPNAYSTSLNEYNQSSSSSILNSVYATNPSESLFNCYRMEPKNAMTKQANGEVENSSFEHLLMNRSNALGFGYPFGNAAANCYLSAAAVAAAAAAAASQNNSNNQTPVASSDSTLSNNYNSFNTNAQQMQHSGYGNQSMMNNESQLSLTPTSSSSSSSSSASSASSVSSSSKGTKSNDYINHSKLDNDQSRVAKNTTWSNDMNKTLNSWNNDRKGEQTNFLLIFFSI